MARKKQISRQSWVDERLGEWLYRQEPQALFRTMPTSSNKNFMDHETCNSWTWESDLSQVSKTHSHIHPHPSPTSRQVSSEKEQFSPGGGSLMGGLSWLPMVGSSLIYSLLCLWIQSTPPTLVLQKLLQYKLVLDALDFHVNDSYVRLLPFSKLLFWFIPVVCCLLSRVLYLIVEQYEFFVTCFSVLLWAGTRGISRFY